MTEEVKDLLQSMATQLGVTIDHVTQAYCKYKMVDSLKYFIMWIIFNIVLLVLMRKALYFFKMGEDAAQEKYNIDPYDYDADRYVALVILTILFIVSIIGTFLSTGWITWLFAPEGAFYNEVITNLKGL